MIRALKWFAEKFVCNSCRLIKGRQLFDADNNSKSHKYLQPFLLTYDNAC